MAKFVPDIKTNRWVIIAPARINQPHDNPTTPAATRDKCPFCPEQDHLNRELFSISQTLPTGRRAWKVRVIANKYPFTDYHEVIIHSPDHDKDLHNLPLKQVELILQTYKQRYNYHVSQGHGQVMIFHNHDIHAGASIKHAHSQLAVIPRQINLDTIPKEPRQNEVIRTKHFVAYCPDFSQWPYEIWLTPNSDAGYQTSDFGHITDSQISDLAPLLQKILAFIHVKFAGEKAVMKQPMDLADETGETPYNFYIYHGPDWYLRIIPRLVHRAGFELGTGLSVNIVDPSVAAQEYKTGLNDQ
jgi:UDPglucose--hexose-1-phosphate uridylyltransferase